MKVTINNPKVKVNISQKEKVKAIISDTLRIPGGGKIQIYKGDTEPTDSNILIWIDTSVPPIIGSQLITADNLKFITKDNKAFILKEEQKSQLITSDGLNFITADDKEFILKEIVNQILLTSDGMEFLTIDNEKFILKEE